MKKNLILLFIVFFIETISGQTRPTGRPTSSFPGSSQSTMQTQEQDSTAKPPFVFTYNLRENRNQKYIVVDTSLNNFFNEGEIAKRKKFNAINTGNNGSSPLLPIFDFNVYSGYHSGFHQYDHYNYTFDSLKLYKSKRTFSDLYFSQILGNQFNFETGAEFSKEFQNEVSLNLSYKRVLQQGIYQEQQTRTTNLALSLDYNFMKGKLKMITALLTNKNTEQHNGGSEDFNHLDDVFALRTNVPINLKDASTRYDYTDYIHQSEYVLKLNKEGQISSSLGHSFLYKSGSNKFGDNLINDKTDSAFYKAYTFDSRGIRNYFSISQVSNEFFIFGNYKWASGRLKLIYDRFDYSYDKKLSRNDITIGFDGVVSVGQNFNLLTNAKFGAGTNIGNFDINASSTFSLSKALSLTAKVDFFRSELGMIDEKLFLINGYHYEETFTKPVGSKLAASLYIPFIKTSVSFSQNLVTNYVYRDTLNFSKQDNSVLSVTNFAISNKINVWKLNLETHLLLQTSNKDYVTQPSQYIKSNFYFESPMFRRNLLLRIGAEYKLMPNFRKIGYDPVVGSYYVTAKDVREDFQGVDLYLSGKVKKFRIFVKCENLLGANPFYFVENHRLFDRNVRFGIRWILLD